jgi:hypothetical protein
MKIKYLKDLIIEKLSLISVRLGIKSPTSYKLSEFESNFRAILLTLWKLASSICKYSCKPSVVIVYSIVGRLQISV